MAGSWHCFNHITQFIWDCELTHSSDWFMGQMGKTGQNLHGSNASIPAKKGLFDEAGWEVDVTMILPHQNVYPEVNHCILDGGLDDWEFFAYIGIFTIPTDFHVHIFQRVAQPPTSISSCYYMFPSPFTYQKRGFIGHWKFSAFGIGFPGSLPNRCSVMDEVRCKGSHDHYEWKSGRVASAKRNDLCLSIWRFPKRGGIPKSPWVSILSPGLQWSNSWLGWFWGIFILGNFNIEYLPRNHVSILNLFVFCLKVFKSGMRFVLENCVKISLILRRSA